MAKDCPAVSNIVSHIMWDIERTFPKTRETRAILDYMLRYRGLSCVDGAEESIGIGQET